MDLLKILLNEQPIELRIGKYVIDVSVSVRDGDQDDNTTSKENSRVRVIDSRESIIKEYTDELLKTSPDFKTPTIMDKPHAPSEDFFRSSGIRQSTIDMLERIVSLVTSGRNRRDVAEILNIDYHREYRYRKMLGHVARLLETTPNKVYVSNTTGVGRVTLNMIEDFLPEIKLYVGSKVYKSL